MTVDCRPRIAGEAGLSPGEGELKGEENIEPGWPGCSGMSRMIAEVYKLRQLLIAV